MKYLVQTENIAEEKAKDLDYGRVAINTEDNNTYLIGYKNEIFEYNLIDLGLPSGTLWCDRNVGAKSIDDNGYFFQWGNTDTVWNGFMPGITDGNYEEVVKEYILKYKYAKTDSSGNYDYSKYVIEERKSNFDGKSILERTDDMAFMYTHKYFLPSVEQVVELIDNTDCYMITTDDEEIQGTLDSKWHDINWDFGTDEHLAKSLEFRKKDNNSIKISIPSINNTNFAGFHLWSKQVGGHTTNDYIHGDGLQLVNVDQKYQCSFNGYDRYLTFPCRGVLNVKNKH